MSGLGAPVARATPADECGRVHPESAVRSWAPPLDTRVTVHLKGLSLRDALDRVSAQAGVELAYSSERLQLDRLSCVDATDAPLGAVLGTVLAASGAEATVVAGHIVIAPFAGRAPEATEMARDVGTLQRVVVTGSTTGAPRRPLTIGVEVIDGARLRRESRTSLGEVIDVAAPGMWMWERSPSNLVAQYGGIRGASSFSTSYPKIYIDGIEVANPLLVTDINPDAIDHIEVIRGPQGSALYGSDAISGVINVVSRHEATENGASLHVSSTAGAGTTSFGTALVRTHDQRIAYRGGSNLFATGLALEFGQTGAVTPASTASRLLISGDTRYVGTGAITTVTAHFTRKRAGVGFNPLLSGVVAPTADAAPQSVSLYTLGVSTIGDDGGRWTQSLIAGIDGYDVSHVADSIGPFTIAADSSLRAAEGSGDRMSIRASTTGRFGQEAGELPTTVTFGLEEALLRQHGIATTARLSTGGTTEYQDISVDSWNHNSGVFTQASTAWRNTLFVTGGLRVERNDAFSGAVQLPLLPMLGVAWVDDAGPIQIKLRSAYGKGIRPPQTPARNVGLMQRGDWRVLTLGLDPESQSGVETGLEVYLGGVASLQVTRFDQLASGLIQNVTIGMDSSMRDGMVDRRARYELQNVGAIGNHGWETQAFLRLGELTLRSALTFVDSRVRTLAAGYNGDLQIGDRMLAVPARTFGTTATWTKGPGFASLAITRASDWIDYDRLALARAYSASTTTEPITPVVGSQLRAYWIPYTGETNVRLTTSWRLRGGLEATVTGDNLLGGQLGQPDNLSIRAGRTIAGGMRASF